MKFKEIKHLNPGKFDPSKFWKLLSVLLFLLSIQFFSSSAKAALGCRGNSTGLIYTQVVNDPVYGDYWLGSPSFDSSCTPYTPAGATCKRLNRVNSDGTKTFYPGAVLVNYVEEIPCPIDNYVSLLVLVAGAAGAFLLRRSFLVLL